MAGKEACLFLDLSKSKCILFSSSIAEPKLIPLDSIVLPPAIIKWRSRTRIVCKSFVSELERLFQNMRPIGRYAYTNLHFIYIPYRPYRSLSLKDLDFSTYLSPRLDISSSEDRIDDPLHLSPLFY